MPDEALLPGGSTPSPLVSPTPRLLFATRKSVSFPVFADDDYGKYRTWNEGCSVFWRFALTFLTRYANLLVLLLWACILLSGVLAPSFSICWFADHFSDSWLRFPLMISASVTTLSILFATIPLSELIWSFFLDWWRSDSKALRQTCTVPVLSRILGSIHHLVSPDRNQHHLYAVQLLLWMFSVMVGTVVGVFTKSLVVLFYVPPLVVVLILFVLSWVHFVYWCICAFLRASHLNQFWGELWSSDPFRDYQSESSFFVTLGRVSANRISRRLLTTTLLVLLNIIFPIYVFKRYRFGCDDHLPKQTLLQRVLPKVIFFGYLVSILIVPFGAVDLGIKGIVVSLVIQWIIFPHIYLVIVAPKRSRWSNVGVGVLFSGCAILCTMGIVFAVLHTASGHDSMIYPDMGNAINQYQRIFNMTEQLTPLDEFEPKTSTFLFNFSDYQPAVSMDDSRLPQSYPACGFEHHGLSLMDYLAFAETTSSYSLQAYPPMMNDDWEIVGKGEGPVYFLEFYSPSRNLSVIAVRGSVRAFDVLLDVDWFTESALLSLVQSIYPCVSVLPNDYLAFLLRISNFFDNALTIHQQEYHLPLLRYVEDRTRPAPLVLTGHSLGGAVAKSVAALSRAGKAIVFSAPGLLNVRGKFGLTVEELYTSTNVRPRYDIVSHIDVLGGAVLHIGCYHSGLSAIGDCHQTTSTMRTLGIHCGSKDLLYLRSAIMNTTNKGNELVESSRDVLIVGSSVLVLLILVLLFCPPDFVRKCEFFSPNEDPPIPSLELSETYMILDNE